MLTCRILFFLTFAGWVLSSCERHEISETKVLHRGHSDHGHDDKEHHPKEAPSDHHDSKKGEATHAPEHSPKPSAPAKEEPRNIGI